MQVGNLNATSIKNREFMTEKDRNRENEFRKSLINI